MYARDFPGNKKKHRDYSALFLSILLLINETTIGITETTIIPITTNEKLSLTIGKLPKKYPASVQSNTQTVAPKIL